MNTRTTTAAAVLLTAGLLLTGCSDNSYQPSPQPATTTSAPATSTVTGTGPAACRAAIKAQYAPGTLQLTGAPTQPPACEGISADDLSQIVSDVIAENTGG